MVIVDEANLSVMTWSSRTCRNVTKVAAYRRTFREFQRKDRPIPESVVEIDRDGATVRERIGAAASTQTECGCDSGYLVARRSNVAVERLQSRRCEAGAGLSTAAFLHCGGRRGRGWRRSLLASAGERLLDGFEFGAQRGDLLG